MSSLSPASATLQKLFEQQRFYVSYEQGGLRRRWPSFLQSLILVVWRYCPFIHGQPSTVPYPKGQHAITTFVGDRVLHLQPYLSRDRESTSTGATKRTQTTAVVGISACTATPQLLAHRRHLTILTERELPPSRFGQMGCATIASYDLVEPRAGFQRRPLGFLLHPTTSPRGCFWGGYVLC